MTSHEYAHKLQELAAWLLARPDFDGNNRKVYMWINLESKEQTADAIRSLGSGAKSFGDNEFRFLANSPEGTHVEISVPRNKVCKLVRAAEYDCEPILTPEEAAAL